MGDAKKCENITLANQEMVNVKEKIKYKIKTKIYVHDKVELDRFVYNRCVVKNERYKW